MSGYVGEAPRRPEGDSARDSARDSTAAAVGESARSRGFVGDAPAARLTADRTRCIGAAQCLLAAPDLFDQDDDGLVVASATEVSGTARREAEQAALLCPVRAIEIAEAAPATR